MKQILMGNHAVSWAVKLARAQVISAYPITPQTQIVELLSEMCASGELKAKFIKVESEHSAMACLIGAASAGVRTFTATSSQGLALMHELLFWAAYGRLPIVLANVNRAMAPGWSIWSDQTDSLAQRDTGWIQLYSETNQEILDTAVIAFKLAEALYLPVMIAYDAFYLSHTYEPVDIPDQKIADQFLPPFKPKYTLSNREPHGFFPLVSPTHYMELRHIMEEAHQQVPSTYETMAREYERLTGRYYGAVEFYKCDNAKIILATSGSMTSTARASVDKLRSEGEKVGLIKLKMFRPFPRDIIREIKAQKLAVFDRDISHGIGGIWAQEIRAALYNGGGPKVFGFLAGLGGREVTPETFFEGYKITKGRKEPEKENYWLGCDIKKVA